jgi:hypothetical protein
LKPENIKKSDVTRKPSVVHKISLRRREFFSPYACTIRSFRSKSKTIAIQRRIDPLGERYYDGLMIVMQYLDGLSFRVTKGKK